MKGIQTVDKVVQETEQLFSDFYHDSNTTFIFTSDHGMADRGNHGDGGQYLLVRHSLSTDFRVSSEKIHITRKHLLLHGVPVFAGRSSTSRPKLMTHTPLPGILVT